METWWNEVLNHSYRDQLSLFYAIWKNPDFKYKILKKDIFNNRYFQWGRVHKRTVTPEIKKNNGMPNISPIDSINISEETEKPEPKKVIKPKKVYVRNSTRSKALKSVLGWI